MEILNIAGYKFLTLPDKEILQKKFLEKCFLLELKGTILLSDEGININISGLINNINNFKQMLYADERFSSIRFNENYSKKITFKRLKIKIKKEIITMKQSGIKPTHLRAPSIPPEVFKQWLDEKRDITILDTRNDFEVKMGTFFGAVNLGLENFSEFPAASQHLDKNKSIVMFCTGGIRCEKAALYLLEQNFKNVYQLDGGILNYFTKIGSEHYQGECFVFDDRISISATTSEET